MNLNRLISVIAALTVAAISFSQPGPGGFQGRRGGMMMRGGMGSPAMLLSRQDVRDDLKLTGDQVTKLEALRTDMMASMREAMRDAQGDPEARTKIFEKMNADSTKKVGEILTPEQTKRLKEIRVQLAGPMAVTDPEIAKELALTESQNAKIKSLNESFRAASQALGEKVRNGEMDWQQMGETMRKNGDVLRAEVEKVLTDSQKTKLKEMGGAKFEAKDQPGGPGR